ncbi:MAG: hypothetical protein K6G17_00825 [Oscillospiraceae bacterium]|nr:hypothetical protein [Oscillospiraceae bacterium]
MGWKCLVEGKELADVRADRRTVKRVEKYGLSGQAIYFQGCYIPFSAICALRAQPSLYMAQCGCGKGIPVFRIRVDYGAEKPEILMVEKEKSAERILEAVREANPGVPTEFVGK